MQNLEKEETEGGVDKLSSTYNTFLNKISILIRQSYSMLAPAKAIHHNT